MSINPKVEAIISSLSKMGLVDRFYFLIGELYEEYFDGHNRYFEVEFEDENIRDWEEAEYIHNKFLQTFGNQ